MRNSSQLWLDVRHGKGTFCRYETPWKRKCTAPWAVTCVAVAGVVEILHDVWFRSQINASGSDKVG